MLISGIYPNSEQEAMQLAQAGYTRCRNPLCDHMLDPDEVDHAHDHYNRPKNTPYTCNHCGINGALSLEPGKNPPGGTTSIGLDPKILGDLAENIVSGYGHLGPYGPILWWSGVYNAALDGLVKDWGVEVKGTTIYTQRERGVIRGLDKPSKVDAILNPIEYAEGLEDPDLLNLVQNGKILGLLGVLALMDFHTSLASIWAHEMPIRPGRQYDISDIKHITKKVLIAENVPFENPLPDPRQPGFVPYHQRQSFEQSEEHAPF